MFETNLLEIIATMPSFIILGFSAIILAASVRRGKPARVFRTPKISVIVVAWNEGKRIERCVRSIMGSDYPKKNTEIIVVGGGTDNTVEVCKRLQRSGSIKFLEEKKRAGKWFALNRAIGKARHDYLAFTDADGIVRRGWLKNLASYKDADIVVSSSDALTDADYIGKLFSVAQPYGSFVSYGLTKVFNAAAFSGLGSFMKKSLARKIKFEKSVVEDYRFCYEAAKKGYKIVVDLDTPILQGTPQTIWDLRKCYLRIFHGFIAEMIPLREPFTIFLLVIGILSLISTIFRILIPGIPWNMSLLAGLLLTVISVINMLIISRVYKSDKYFFRFPYLVFHFVFVQLIGIESFFRFLIRKNIGWPIYNKR